MLAEGWVNVGMVIVKRRLLETCWTLTLEKKISNCVVRTLYLFPCDCVMNAGMQRLKCYCPRTLSDPDSVTSVNLQTSNRFSELRLGKKKTCSVSCSVWNSNSCNVFKSSLFIVQLSYRAADQGSSPSDTSFINLLSLGLRHIVFHTLFFKSVHERGWNKTVPWLNALVFSIKHFDQ